MLVLSRKVQERIFIGNDIVITVTSMRNGRVWLGIEAPRDIRVDREEVRLAIERENRENNKSG